MIGPLLLAAFGIWLLAQTAAGGLPARLLSRRQNAAGETSAALFSTAVGAGTATSPPSSSGSTLTSPGPRPDLTTWQGATLSVAVMPSYQRMVNAAARDGITLAPIGSKSTFRTLADQLSLRVENGCPDVNTSPPEACRIPTAIPGTSKHERGEAIDFVLAGGAQGWLQANALRHGFVGNVPNDPVHYSWGGG